MPEPTIKSRIEGMIWGQFIGDAMCLGAHWIYNLTDLHAFYPDLKGFESPRPGHYHAGKQPGDFTHYGEAALILLESIAEQGRLDTRNYGKRFVGHFGSPDYSGYLDSATRGTLENTGLETEKKNGDDLDYQFGADDDQLATATSLAPVVARYYADPELLHEVTRVTRVRQNHPRSIAYMQFHALLLKELLSGTDLHSAVHRVEEIAAKDVEFGAELAMRFRDAFERKHLSTTEATAQLGQSCPLKNSFPSALVAVIKTPEDFEGTLQRILAAGGDNAGRAAMAGAWLGAHLGFEAIPSYLPDKLRAAQRIQAAVRAILSQIGL